MQKISCFLPCRKGSERIINKNTKKFADHKDGLLEIKLNQLERVEEIENIVVSTNDPKVIEIASNKIYSKVELDLRPNNLADSSTSTDELISYVPCIIEKEHIIWTHVTSPFINENYYKKAILKYFEIIQNKNFDSLMSVKKHRNFFWNTEGPINYDSSIEKWPRTQTLSPLYEINSGFFLCSRKLYVSLKDRIGKKPFFFNVDAADCFDIDWPEDFNMAEEIWRIRNE